MARGSPVTPPKLSDRYLNLLHEGDTKGEYGGDGSRLVAAIVMHAVNQGLPKALVYKLLVHPQNRGGFAALHRHRNLERWFTTVWDSATRKVEASPVILDRQEAALRAQELLEAAEAQPWPGRGGATDLAVLTAVVSICQRVGKVIAVPMSVREVAELAKVNHSTVIRSLRRLTAAGWLQPAATSGGGRSSNDPTLTPRLGAGSSPSSYTLLVAATPLHQSFLHRKERPDWCGGVTPSDVFRWGGLGLSAKRVFELLDVNQHASSVDIAASLGVHKRTVQRHLANLKKYGLAVPDDDGWRRGDADLGHVADDLGVAGASFAQKRRHQNERAERAAAFSSRGSAAEGADSRRRESVEAPGPPGAPAPLPRAGPGLLANTWRATA